MPPAAHQTPRADAAPPAGQGSGLSRREVLVGAGGTGLLAAVGAGALRAPAASAAARDIPAGDGTPEQVHLTWGNDPASPRGGVVGLAGAGGASASAARPGPGRAGGDPGAHTHVHGRAERGDRLDLPRGAHGAAARYWRRPSDAPLDDYGVDAGDGLRQAKVFTKANRPIARRGRPGPGPGPRRTRSRTPRGLRCATRPPATGSRSSTSTRVSRAVRPRSRSRTTTRQARTGQPGYRCRRGPEPAVHTL